jgi:uridine kinase
MVDLCQVLEKIQIVCRQPRSRGCPLVAVSGIDGSGKGYVSALIERALVSKGVRVAVLNIDGWLNLPERRFDRSNPAEHFYLHAIRFEEMFSTLVDPLRARRSVHLVADFVEETALEYRKETYDFQNIDLVLLEGIYLLKSSFRSRYDLSFWIECTFETALRRAVNRGQEGLSPEATIHAYETIYFPAQKLHLKRDAPRAGASAVIVNDPLMVSRSG